MRFGTIILTVILALQVFLPCEDICERLLAGGINTENIACNDSHDTDEHSSCCSPFCQCSCCSVEVVFFPALVKVTESATAYVDKVYSEPYISEVLSADIAIWHPPQV